jgi:pyridoxal phosphate enzyme (YggS family)
MDMTEEGRVREISLALAQVEERIARACLRAARSRDDVTLIAVTKTYPYSDVQILQQLGVKNFGENRDGEGAEKSARAHDSFDASRWHYQGEIQSKKIGSISRWADAVHSLDDLAHIQKFDRALDALGGKTIEVFIQVSLDGNSARSGLQSSDVLQACQVVADSSHLQLMGIMTVPPVGSEPEKSFSRIAEISESVKKHFPEAGYLSAGMSGDFDVAIAYGATHIRIGSQILGSRGATP